MPPKKKKTKPSRPDDGEDGPPGFSVARGSDGSSSDSDSSIDSQMEVQVEFEARMIDETDFHGIRRLLQQAFLKAPLDLSGLTELLISQARHIGSVVKVCDEEADDGEDGEEVEEESEGGEVYGVTSAINLTHHKAKGCVKQICDWLLSQCKTHCGGKLPQLTALLSNDSKPAAFLVNERFLNIPVDIAPLLLKSLLAEVKEAESRHPGQFAVEYYVVIARSHLVSMPKLKMGKKRKKKATSDHEASNTTPSSSSADEPIFDFYENELIHRESTLSFSYPVGEESDQVLGGKWDMYDKAMKPFRTLMVIEAKKLERCIVELEQAIRSN